MALFFIKKAKKIIPLLLLFIFVFFPFHNAFGQNIYNPSTTDFSIGGIDPAKESGSWLMGIAASAIEYIVSWIVYVIGFVVAVIFALGGSLLSFFLELNSMILNLEVIHKGWQITRDIINLGFVLAILFISFATIIRYESYGMRSLLSKLIITAILINFSLVISGVILDFAGIITEFFVKNSTGDYHQFALKLADITQIQSLSVPPDSAAAGGAAVASSLLTAIIAPIFAVAFGAVGAVVFLGLAGMFLWRFVKLSYLLILSPLAWFSGIFPAFSKYNKKWWSDFLSATFYAPASTFFLYLAILSMEPSSDKKYNSLSDFGNLFVSGSSGGNDLTNNLDSTASASISLGGVFGAYLSSIGTMIMVMGFLVGSILVASKTGSGAASLAMGTVNKMKGWAMGKMKNIGAGIGRAGARAGRGIVRGATSPITPGEETIKKWSEAEGRFSGIKKLAAKGGMRFSKAVSAEKSTKAHEAFVSKINDDQLQFEYNTAIDGAKKAAIVKEAIKRGKAGKLSLKDSDVVNYKNYGGDMKKFETSYPWLAEKISAAKNKADANIGDVEQATFDHFSGISSEDLGKIDVVKTAEKLSDIKVGEAGKEKSLDFYGVVIKKGDGSFASDLLRGKDNAKRRQIVNNLVIAALSKDEVEEVIINGLTKAGDKKTLGDLNDEKRKKGITKFKFDSDDLLRNEEIKRKLIALKKKGDVDPNLIDFLLNVNAARMGTKKTEKKETKESGPPLPKSGTEIPGTGETL
ncbi:MAG: hypothetical protein A2430_01655 [Candidatus Liptonbacteria bacterium RIFOXYC1_FULL_36_8]|uniref:Uncharacterized protein n=2 Tax=Candidatus Liptoniibacteriota TaxID=1817909 RepID=A0A1G2CRH0_9BACT|nr:MAG: hypothetical protein A2390_01020 [Candidatus Liptonbacteria bacterium RIFOXYB1_FULL_36_10]OGZ03901.1 MAG: hypothetical protein A2430_01655 [Candidatus Liptonbacteria bacterium RIFOXYC1_FULL_36_8]